MFAVCLGLSSTIWSQFTLDVCPAAKNLQKTKPPISAVQSHSRSSMLMPLNSSSPVLVMCDKQHVCVYLQPFHARRVNSGKITTFWRYPYLTPACSGFLELRGSHFALLKYSLMLKISYASCLGVSPAISAQFTF